MIEPPQGASTSSDHFYIITAGIVAILVVLIPLLFSLIRTSGAVRQARQDVTEIKHQVKNDHTVNLRDDTDKKHEENLAKQAVSDKKLDRVLTIVTTLSSTVTDIQTDVRELKTTSAEHTEQIEDIERTQDRRNIRPRHA